MSDEQRTCVGCGTFKIAILDREYNETWCERCWNRFSASEQGTEWDFIEPD